MKFVDVTNDIAFRKIFGNENKKTSLISFLNAVLGFVDNDTIEDVTIKNPYQLPQYSGGKTTIVDVKAKDRNGNTFIVEMQVAEVKDFDKRVLYYASQSYTDQIERGDLYPNLKPTFFIGILNFNATQNNHYLSRHKILDVETGENLIKNFEFNFIELEKFNKEANDLLSIIDQWVYFIKNAENLEIIPDTITDEGLKDAFEQANKHNWTAQELEDYNKVFIREQDERGRLELAEDKGMKKGGMEEKIKMFNIMESEGESIEKIIKYTGLTKEEIAQHRK
jgi:predicted transposase/invertase (TIGR01784 family)